jgi:Flp pilus assembly protein TadD
MLSERYNWLGMIVCIFSFMLYLNTLDHAYVLDDFSVIKDNFLVKKGIEGIPEIFTTHYRYGYGYVQANLYRPLTLSLFAIQWEIAPDQPSLGHFCNILFYSLCVGLLFKFLIQLWGAQHKTFAFAASLLFASHPIHTEVVANIKSLDDILALSLCLISTILYLNYVEKSNKKHLLLANLFFFLALLSKESAVVFLGIIPLSIWMFREGSLKSLIRPTFFMLIPFSIFLSMRTAVLGSLGGDESIAKIDNLLMAAPNGAIKLATAIKILGLYLWKLIFPHPLMNDYSINQISLSDFQDWRVWLAFLIYVSLIYLFFKYRKDHPQPAFGIAFFLIGISIYSNIFITIGTSFGERLMFIPSIGYSILLGWLLFKLSRSKLAQPKLKFEAKLWLPLILVLALYSFKTIDRNADWKDNFTLYSTDVKHCDRSARCHYYNGLGLMKEKAMQTKDRAQKRAFLSEAIKAFSQSIEILPGYSDAYGQRGLAYYRLKNYQAALADYNKAIQIKPQNATSHSNRGTLLFEMGDYQNAKLAFEQALKYQPNFVDALANYASTLGTMGDYQGSITYFQKAIQLRPNEPSYYQMIGVSYQNMGKTQEANYYLNQAQKIRRQKP